MKISIWRQFSSNHSNSFTLVGKFDTVEKAKEVEKEFKRIIRAIQQSRVERIQSANNIHFDEATDEEKKLGTFYDIEWTEHLDWIDGEYQVAGFGTYVMVSDVLVQTYKAALYVDEIMKKLGAAVIFVEREMGIDILSVELTCQHNNDKNTQQLFKTLNTYFELVRTEKDDGINPPWRDISKELFDYERFKTMDDIYYGYLNIDEKYMKFTNLKFATIGYGLPALIAYLKHEGCKDIKYIIEQRDEREVYGDDL